MLTETTSSLLQYAITDGYLMLKGLIIAIIVFLLGWVVSMLVSRFLGGIFKKIKLEEAFKHHKVEDALGSVKISDVLTKIVKYYILLIFLQAAVEYIALDSMADFLTTVLVHAPAIIGGFLVFLLAVILGEYLKEMIMELSKSQFVKLLARAVKLILIYVGATTGLATAGFNTTLLDGSFMTILQALSYGVAGAIAIAFGLGGQEDAKSIIKTGRKHFKV